MRAKVRMAGVVTGQNERGFDVHGRRGRVREGGFGGQRALFGQVQETGFGVGVDVQRGGRQEEWRRAVHGPAGEHRGRNGLGTGSDGTPTGLCSRVRERERGEGGRRGRGGGERVWRGRPLLLRGGADETGVRPIGRRLVRAAKIFKVDT